LITIISVGTANEVIQLPDNIGILQENFIFDTTHIFPRQLLSEINLETWTKESTLYSIENTASNDTFDFYFHRRKNLLKNKFHRIQ
jgi:hypothetical protein